MPTAAQRLIHQRRLAMLTKTAEEQGYRLEMRRENTFYLFDKENKALIAPSGLQMFRSLIEVRNRLLNYPRSGRQTPRG